MDAPILPQHMGRWMAVTTPVEGPATPCTGVLAMWQIRSCVTLSTATGGAGHRHPQHRARHLLLLRRLHRRVTPTASRGCTPPGKASLWAAPLATKEAVVCRKRGRKPKKAQADCEMREEVVQSPSAVHYTLVQCREEELVQSPSAVHYTFVRMVAVRF